MSKLLSVIIPLYNSAQWLPKCLDSVLNQDVPLDDLEVVCVDDGSPDNSRQIVFQYQVKYPDTIVVLSQENQGPSGARNNGMQHASGRYLCFVDPDDYLEPNVFCGLVKTMEREHLDMLRFNYRIVDENDKPVEKRAFERQFDYSQCVMSGAEFLANRLDTACNIWRYLYRTELIVANGIWCFTGDFFDDTPWLPIVLMKAGRLGVLDTIVYVYQERSGSLINANTLPAVQKKIEGCFLLIHLLQEEMSALKGKPVDYLNMDTLYTISVTINTRAKILQWYEMMIALCVVTLLADVAVYDYNCYRVYLNRLRQMCAFPLSANGALNKNRLKIWLINCNPALMVKMIHYKNSILP